jgi:acetate kinase
MSAGSVLVVNAGSTSLKLRLLGPQDELVANRDLSAGEPWEAGLEAFLDTSPQPDAAGHRVVHGGTEHSAPALVDGELESRLHELEELAPLHNPAAVRAIRDLRRLRPDLPSVACFDTAYHRDLPAAASTYAVPAAWAERWPLRRFGFHGLSHAYCARRTASLLGRPPSDLRIVTAHLGAGASLAAVAGGRSVDTTMGFTPLDGLVMATRPGSVDPGLLLWVQRHGELDPDSVEHALETESGLLGISGRSGDMRELQGAASEDQRAALAIAVYLHRLRASIAAMAAAMEGLDALAFTGGVGEGSAPIREGACAGLDFLGVAIDPRRNGSNAAGDRLLSADGSKPIVVVHAREDLEIAAQVRSVVESGDS